METRPHSFCDNQDTTTVRVRCLALATDPPFEARGDHLRRCISAVMPDEPVLHHHEEGVRPFGAPPVRFLVVQGVPCIVGLAEGIAPLEVLYRMEPLVLRNRGEACLVVGRELWDDHAQVGVRSQLSTYRSLSPWLALNQQNFERYRSSRGRQERRALLERIFIGNVLAMFKSLELRVRSQLYARVLGYRECPVSHKGTEMLGFLIRVDTNVFLHPWLGIGKLVSKGFGVFTSEV